MGQTTLWNIETAPGLSLRLHKSALVAALGVIERAPCFRREPGFFIGSMGSKTENTIVLDRFDSGRMGQPTLLMPRDYYVKVGDSSISE